MTPSRKLSRRSFFARVAGGAIAVPLLAGRARAQTTDSDTGFYADPAGSGRGLTDNDTGPDADLAGQGRGGVTDNDSGASADPAGNGRGRRRRACSGHTDNDGGVYADPVRCGRGPRA